MKAIYFQKNLLDSTGAYTEEAGCDLAGRLVADKETENTGSIFSYTLICS